MIRSGAPRRAAISRLNTNWIERREERGYDRIVIREAESAPEAGGEERAAVWVRGSRSGQRGAV